MLTWIAHECLHVHVYAVLHSCVYIFVVHACIFCVYMSCKHVSMHVYVYIIIKYTYGTCMHACMCYMSPRPPSTWSANSSEAVLRWGGLTGNLLCKMVWNPLGVHVQIEATSHQPLSLLEASEAAPPPGWLHLPLTSNILASTSRMLDVFLVCSLIVLYCYLYASL